MPIFIQKLSESGGQFRVTLPKDLIKGTPLEKARVVQIWMTKDKVIHMEEYAKYETRKRGNKAGRSKTD